MLSRSISRSALPRPRRARAGRYDRTNRRRPNRSGRIDPGIVNVACHALPILTLGAIGFSSLVEKDQPLACIFESHAHERVS